MLDNCYIGPKCGRKSEHDSPTEPTRRRCARAERPLISQRPCSLVGFISPPVQIPHVIVKSFTGGELLAAESANNCVLHAVCARPRDHHWSRGVSGHGCIPFSLFIFRIFPFPFTLPLRLQKLSP